MSPSQIKEFFVEAGRVASVEVIYDRVTDRSRGFAFVTMGSEEQAVEAIRMFVGSGFVADQEIGSNGMALLI